MSDNPSVILSGFADEAANQKTATQQFSAFAAMGLQYYTIRFIDAGNGVKNVMQLTKQEISTIRHLENEYGLNVSSLGSPIGKVKLVDIDDGTKNRFVPFRKYLSSEVKKACELAHAFETKLIRGFSFYHPRGTDPRPHIPQVIDQLGEIAGNIVTQGCSASEVYAQYLAMKPGLGWMHIKDYRHPNAVTRQGHVDEAALKHFVPADIGDSGHEQILRDFREYIPKLAKSLSKRGVPGVFLDLEPHVKGGGQFGGFSGPDGMAVALRGLCRVLDYVGIDYHLRDFEDVRAARGF